MVERIPLTVASPQHVDGAVAAAGPSGQIRAIARGGDALNPGGCKPGAAKGRLSMDEATSPPVRVDAAAGAAIEVVDLVKTYKGVVAVDHLSFAIARGSITGLLGGNGAGKTTTIGMIMGLILPSSGHVRVLGTDMIHDRYGVLARMNFESPYVDMPHRLTVRQNLQVFGRLYAVADLKARIAMLARDLALEDFLDRRSGELSAGQKTRVALAKALLNEPEVMLLDEPTASLDPDTADWVRTHLETYQRGKGATILLASHNMAEVERLCDRVIMLKQGKIVGDGTPAEFLARYGRKNLEEVFLDLARGRRQADAAVQ
jgi:ABC-2 type transport system ATP-binding protein